MNEPSPQICTECNKPCRAVVPAVKPSAGEWYCDNCGKSWRMTEMGEGDYWLAILKRGH